MKITKQNLQKLVREQVGEKVGVRSLTKAAIEFIKQNGRVASPDLETYLFDNNDIEDDDRLWDMITWVTGSKRFEKLYNEEDDTFSMDRQ